MFSRVFVVDQAVLVVDRVKIESISADLNSRGWPGKDEDDEAAEPRLRYCSLTFHVSGSIIAGHLLGPRHPQLFGEAQDVIW